jgi:hypothetical protein
MCKSWCESILGVVILIFALWQTMYSKWIIVIAAIVLIIHSFMCKQCFMRHNDMPMKKKR